MSNDKKEQSEEGAIQYALGYQDGFLDAKKQFEGTKAKPYERPKPHPAAFCDGDCIHCKIIDECEKADGGES